KLLNPTHYLIVKEPLPCGRREIYTNSLPPVKAFGQLFFEPAESENVNCAKERFYRNHQGLSTGNEIFYSYI
ncbi:MAG: hypothetical protein K9K79_13300, partial [Desulfohalobiaceae bacterium]|nr:hypothetical protein [Desulfohalobiaceae bacterium]